MIVYTCQTLSYTCANTCYRGPQECQRILGSTESPADYPIGSSNMESFDFGSSSTHFSGLTSSRCTKLCKKDINQHCIRGISCSWLNFARREAANQTQWFDGVIRTVYSVCDYRLIEVERRTNLRPTDLYIFLLFAGENQISSKPS